MHNTKERVQQILTNLALNLVAQRMSSAREAVWVAQVDASLGGSLVVGTEEDDAEDRENVGEDAQ